MNQSISIIWLDRVGIEQAQEIVKQHHYLHTRIATVCSVQGYAIQVLGAFAGVLLFGRPQCQRNLPWYGSVEEVKTERCRESRWSILNLARVYVFPAYQQGGNLYRPDLLPGFVDRKGTWRSRLASTAITMALESIVSNYLQARPPCFLDEPYQLTWCLSYSDPRFHKGTIYLESGFERYSENARGLITWRRPLRSLTEKEDSHIQKEAFLSPRSHLYRQKRATVNYTQPPLF